uniref:hypothetical protein n=1 Tax=Arthrobacter sp. TaxID=1667 RepID=UPI000EB70EF8|nr:hypothetical protein [Arthrobacter sp.]AXV46319.1 hypothetical protein pA40H1_p32 [Arthrobacter sp.]
MGVAEGDFRRWLATVAPNTGLTTLSKAAGYSRMLIRQQLAGDRVQEETVIKICRALDLDPLEQLRSFPRHRSLESSPPDKREIGAFIRWEYLLRSCAAWGLEGEAPTESSLGPHFCPETSRQWINDIDPDHGLRKHLQAHGPISSPGLSKNLNGPLRYDLAVLAVQYAALPPVSALVVSRILTPAEAGWEPDERVRWLQGLATIERLQLLENRTHMAIVREQHGGRPAAPHQPFS